MKSPPLTLFNHMTDEDFIVIYNAGQLKNLCLALSLDLQSTSEENPKTYDA